jgi:phosphoribosyl-dephospho-CoA transferase
MPRMPAAIDTPRCADTTQPPLALRRHQLVRLTPEGWQQVLARDWHESARPCLAHWAAHDLPLVVTRQPEPLAAAADADTLHLGLPAPTCWQRQRLSLVVARSAVRAVGELPAAIDITGQLPDAAQAPWRTLCGQLGALGLHAQVYGSHGWQHLTGLAYVRAQSDLDLFVPVPDAQAADAAADLLADATAALPAGASIDSPRLDGELGLADGSAVAWREWRDWRAGRVAQILVKRLQGVTLESGRAWLQRASAIDAEACT